jgi:hypothetical protein
METNIDKLTNNIKLLEDMIKTHFENLHKINELINKPKKSVNIIVVGGAYYHKNEDDYETWNNPKEAKYSDMIAFKKNLENNNYNVEIKAYDYAYPKTLKNIEIPHYKQSFDIYDLNNYKKNTLNIVILFYNRLLPTIKQASGYYKNKGPGYKNIDYSFREKSKTISQNFDVSFMACADWETNFPSETVINIIKYNFITPIDVEDYKSFTKIMNIIKIINDNNIYEIMEPFILATIHFLGYLKNRGDKEGNVIRELLKNEPSLINDLDKETKKNLTIFVNIPDCSWDFLDDNTKKVLCELIYGKICDKISSIY